MSDPIKHHYVPKAYLKEFSNSQKNLFQKIKGDEIVSIKSIGQVCYKLNYFQLHLADSLFLEKLKDQYHIEKNVFKKQENQYPKLVRKFTHPSLRAFATSKSDALFFLEILLTIKRRNPKYRDKIIEDYKNYTSSEEFRKLAETQFETSREVDNIDPVAYFEYFVSESKTNLGKQQNIYLHGFVNGENKIVKKAAELLMRYQLYIYHAPFGKEFITSDNPGFTLLPDGTLYSFGGYAMPFTFLFPLTPKCCLSITYNRPETDFYSLTKEIYVINADNQFVDTVNEGTYNIANQKVFSYSSGTLHHLDFLKHLTNNDPNSEV